MGILDLFGGNADARREKTIAKASMKLKNPHVQTQERQRLIEVLAGYGSEEAVTALLGRFTMRTPGSIVDEDEKRQVYESLVALGDVCLDSLRNFIRSDSNIYWALRALTEIGGKAVAVDVLLEGLTDTVHGYTSDMDRREQLVSNLREYLDDPRAFDKLVVLCNDESVDVRILAIDGLTDADDSRVPAVLMERLEDPDETQRVKATVLDILTDRKVNMKGYKDRMKGHLAEQFFLDDTGIVQRR